MCCISFYKLYIENFLISLVYTTVLHYVDPQRILLLWKPSLGQSS